MQRIGLAAIALLHSLFSNKDKAIRTTFAPIMSILLMASPALPLVNNWKDISRKGDWVAYDYAYNLLNSCEKDGILFTNGDNDTFPLWALQEAYGIRTDIRIVNLSLVNTPWYILQMKNFEPKVPISFTDAQIEKMDAQLNPFDKPTPYHLNGAGIDVVLPSVDQMRVLKVQDQMVLNIVDANRWKKPIYFVTSVGDDVLMGLGPYLKLEGLVYRVMPKPVPEEEKIDIQRSAKLMTEVYKYTNLENGKANLNETSSSLLTNYEASYIQIALALRQPIAVSKAEIAMLQPISASSDSIKTVIAEKQAKVKENLDLAIDMLERCKRIVPTDWRPRILMHEILVENGMIKEAEAEMRKALEVDPNNAEYKNRLAELQNYKTNKQPQTLLPEASVK
jgi:tetratricopeptide (TPR) repeat protein